MRREMLIMVYRGKHRASPRYGERMARAIAAGAAWIVRKWRRADRWMRDSAGGRICKALLVIGAACAVFYIALNAYLNPSVMSGIVVDKTHREASDYQMTWTFGDWSIVRRRHEPESWKVQVRDGNHLEWWEVEREEWFEIDEGDYLKKQR